MKKLFCLLLIVITSLSLFACGGSAPSFSVEVPAPWQSSAAVTPFEKSVYSVQKVDKTTDTVIAEGTLTYTIDFDHKEETITYLSFDASFAMTYNDNAPVKDRGLTDTIASKTVFLGTALTPVSTVKTATLAPREGESANLSYTLSTDYKAGTSTMTLNGVTSTLNFAKKNLSGVYDNEMLYYVIRSYPNLCELNSYLNFKLANFFDMHIADEYKTYQIQIAPNLKQAEETIYLPGLKGKFGLSDEGAVKTIRITAEINDALNGPAIDLYYSKTPFVVGEGLTTKRALAYFSTFEYDVNKSALKYQTNYTLTDYSVTK